MTLYKVNLDYDQVLTLNFFINLITLLLDYIEKKFYCLKQWFPISSSFQVRAQTHVPNSQNYKLFGISTLIYLLSLKS